MANTSTSLVVMNTFLSVVDAAYEAAQGSAARRSKSWPREASRNVTILGRSNVAATPESATSHVTAGAPTKIVKQEDTHSRQKCLASTSTLDAESDSGSMSQTCSTTLDSSQVTEEASSAKGPSPVKQQKQQQAQADRQNPRPEQEEQEPDEEPDQEQSSEPDGKAATSTKLKSSAQRPSKTTRMKCKAIAQRAIDAAMESGSPEAIQALINLAAQTPYMKSILRHSLEHFKISDSAK